MDALLDFSLPLKITGGCAYGRKGTAELNHGPVSRECGTLLGYRCGHGIVFEQIQQVLRRAPVVSDNFVWGRGLVVQQLQLQAGRGSSRTGRRYVWKELWGVARDI